MDSGGTKEPCVGWGSGLLDPSEEGTILGYYLPAYIRRAIDILNDIRSLATAMRPFALSSAAIV